jgi:ADP-ribose pyrophosphatase YjhB (NUDIX family)
MKETFHRHIGVYGICTKKDQLLVIAKGKGPYANRYDLPGGSIEKNETLAEAMCRELTEETGLIAYAVETIGAAEFIVPFSYSGNTHTHHVALLYYVEDAGTTQKPKQFAEQDAKAAYFLPISTFTEENTSPLVMEAVRYIKTGKLSQEAIHYSKWEILE